MEKDYWESYYSKHRRNEVPSNFAVFVSNFIMKDKHLLELGCGNGRDSFYFSKKEGIKITALDQCKEQIADLNSEGIDNITFNAGDFTSYISENTFDYIYSRFTLHSVNIEDEIRTFENANKSLKDGGLMLIEVRSIFDELVGQGKEVGPYEYITDHYRRFVKIEDMIKNGQNANLKLIYSLQAKDLAPFKDKNPIVIRLIFQKRS